MENIEIGQNGGVRAEENLKLLVAGEDELEVMVYIDREIGTSEYGKLFKGFNKKKPSQYFFVKTVQSGDTQDLALLKNEFEVSQALQGSPATLVYLPNIYSSKNNTYLITEFWERTLEEEMKVKEYSEKEVLKIFLDLMTGYKGLYEKKILHQNINPANVFICDGVYSLGGFEHAVFYETHVFDLNKVGLPTYMSPQKLVLKVYKGSPRSDVYSLGVIMYEIIARSHPYLPKEGEDLNLKESRRTLIDTLKQAEAGNIKSNEKSLEFNNMVTIIMKMIHKVESKRVTFQQIQQFLGANDFFGLNLPTKPSKPQSQPQHPQLNESTQLKPIQSAFYPHQLQRQANNKLIQSYLQKNRNIFNVNVNIGGHLMTSPLLENNPLKDSLVLKLIYYLKALNDKVMHEMENHQMFSEDMWLVFNDSESSSIIKLVVQDMYSIKESILGLTTICDILDMEATEAYFEKHSQEEKILVITNSMGVLLREQCELISIQTNESLVLLLYIMEARRSFWTGKYGDPEVLENAMVSLQSKSIEELMQMMVKECQAGNMLCGFDEGTV